MAMMALNFAMPIYATQTLGLAGWVAGALFTINTIMVGFGQGLLVRSLTGRVRNRVLLVANLAFAAVLPGAARRHPHRSWCWRRCWCWAAPRLHARRDAGRSGARPRSPRRPRPTTSAGRYLAWNQLAWTVTGAAAPVTFAALLAQGAAVTWLSMTALSVVGALLTVWLGRVLPHAGEAITNRAEAAVPPSDPDEALVEAPAL